MHPAALLHARWPHLAKCLPEPERAIGDCDFGRDSEASILQVDQQFAPVLRALAGAVSEADQLLLAFRSGADQHKDALLVVLQPGLQMDAIRPDVDVSPGRQIALLPAIMFVAPGLLQPRDRRCRQPRRLPAEQGRQRLLEVAGRDALQVEDRDQHLQALGAARVRRQDRGREADPLGIGGGNATVADARLADGDRPDARHHLALGQVAVANHPLMALLGLQ